MPPDAVLLFVDETILRLFPPLRAKWDLRGKQSAVRITGENASVVLFGAINPKTGHRIVMQSRSMRQGDFQSFLKRLRCRYGKRPLWLLLDRASAHSAPKSVRLGGEFDIAFVWLPKKAPELNAMDHLWKPVKARISANRQYCTADKQADFAKKYIESLSPRQALRKAGVLSKNYWLRAWICGCP